MSPSGISATEATGTYLPEALIRSSTGRAIRDCFGKVLIFLAIGAANRLDRSELLSCSLDLALDHIGFAKILANLRVARIERYCLQVVPDPLIDLAELAGCIAAIVEGLRRLAILHQVEHIERLVVALRFGQGIGIVG